MAREVFQADGFSGLESGDDFYLTDGSSSFRLQMGRGRGEACLTCSFGEKPALLQRTFWAFGLLKLLRPLGFYSLHAAGVVSRQGQGLLIVGGSGCGKSTLTLGLLRQGWGCVSDDAVLLRRQPAGVEALACRKDVYVNADAAPAYADLPLQEEGSDATGRRKRRVCTDKAFPRQQVATCLPCVLLFSRIIPGTHSALHPLGRSTALGELLTQSGPQLFDRTTMPAHLEVLTRLLQQSATYELLAGRDLYHDPLTLEHLLREAEGAG
jgi:hypothetical protein